MSYPTNYEPVYSHNALVGTGDGSPIDIAESVTSGMPPVMIVTFTGTAAYTIQGSHDGVAWHDFTASLTAAAAKDLVPGVRFWRTHVTANSAAFTSAVGPIPGADGRVVRPHIAQVFASPTF